tara:strand:+ start:571 stop:1095 length:525 start_codon:yes stop_codon:yes gene_type:complete
MRKIIFISFVVSSVLCFILSKVTYTYALGIGDQCPKSYKKKTCYAFQYVAIGDNLMWGGASNTKVSSLEQLENWCDEFDGPNIVSIPNEHLENHSCECDKTKQICSQAYTQSSSVINQICTLKFKFITCTPAQFNPFGFKQKSPLGLQKEIDKDAHRERRKKERERNMLRFPGR